MIKEESIYPKIIILNHLQNRSYRSGYFDSNITNYRKYAEKICGRRNSNGDDSKNN